MTDKQIITVQDIFNEDIDLEIEDWVTYVAQDGDGEWYAFASEPEYTAEGQVWEVRDGHSVFIVSAGLAPLEYAEQMIYEVDTPAAQEESDSQGITGFHTLILLGDQAVIAIPMSELLGSR